MLNIFIQINRNKFINPTPYFLSQQADVKIGFELELGEGGMRAG
jgi:hypothetical protein